MCSKYEHLRTLSQNDARKPGTDKPMDYFDYYGVDIEKGSKLKMDKEPSIVINSDSYMNLPNPTVRLAGKGDSMISSQS